MYAKVTLPLTLVSNELNVPFFSTLFQWDEKDVTVVKYIPEETVPQLSVNFGNRISQDSYTRTNIPAPSEILVLLIHDIHIFFVISASRQKSGKYPTRHRIATESLMYNSIPSTDRHVNELWLFQIFLDCVGYQQYFHFRLVSMNNSYVYLNFMHASWSNIEKKISMRYAFHSAECTSMQN